MLTLHLVVSQGFSAAIRTEVQELMRCILDVQREQSRAKFFRECEAKHLTEHVHRLEEELDRKTPSSPDIANRMKLLRLSAQVWAAITIHARARAHTHAYRRPSSSNTPSSGYHRRRSRREMRSWHNSHPQYLPSALRPTTGCGSRKRSAACAYVGTRVVSSTFGTGVHNRTHARPCEGLRRSGLFGPCAADFPHEGAVEDAFGEQGM